MNQSEVLNAVKSYISREVLDGKDIGLDESTPLLEWGIINSIEMARIVRFIQHHFSVKVPADKILPDNFKDLSSITNLVVELARLQQAQPLQT
jgi:acyl carrier protein